MPPSCALAGADATRCGEGRAGRLGRRRRFIGPPLRRIARVADLQRLRLSVRPPARAVPRVAAWGPAVGRLSAASAWPRSAPGTTSAGRFAPRCRGGFSGRVGGALRLPGIGRRIGWLGGLRSRVQEKWRRAAAAISLGKPPGRPTEWSLFPVGQSCGGARTRPARVREADRCMGRFRAEHGLSWSGVLGFSTNSSARNRAVG